MGLAKSGLVMALLVAAGIASMPAQ
ncbi:hypothetical protein, partial [Atlantibacter hermannii]